MAARRALIALALLASLGCHPGQRVPPIMVGPMQQAPSHARFERLVESVRAAGFQIEDADATHGRFRVGSRYADRSAVIGQHAFVVQCFASGHVQVMAVGPRVRSDGLDSVMPPGLRRELVALGQVLDRAL